MKTLWHKDEPIITSLLEVDVYKLLMLYFIHRYYPCLKVSFEFTNRTRAVNLMDHICVDQLQAELDYVKKLSFSVGELDYLRSWGIFPDTFFVWLKSFKLGDICIEQKNGLLSIHTNGLWEDVTLWETIVLAIVSELYSRSYVEKSIKSEHSFLQNGGCLLGEKIKILQQYPQIRFAQFGLRRRASKLWEEYVTKKILKELSVGQMVGISNVLLAKQLGQEAVGTNAHELPMALYALARHSSDVDALNSPYQVLEKWQSLYGHKMLIMLPDTFGTESFVRGVSYKYLLDWRGVRQDSGDPIAFGEKWIDLYKSYGIDPLTKLIIFSDGLNVHEMIRLWEYFHERICVSFGWGTNLTNAIGISPLSLVMKLTQASGNQAVKLSDNLAKATGDSVEIKEAKRIFGYVNQFSTPTLY